jgi:hypothetical protein
MDADDFDQIDEALTIISTCKHAMHNMRQEILLLHTKCKEQAITIMNLSNELAIKNAQLSNHPNPIKRWRKKHV